MYRVRLHGRGGHGIKTAGRILGSAFFSEGYQVQDAPRYGAERRGAPIFAYVRASRQPIHERGVIRDPDLVVVADDTLVQVPTAGVLVGVTPATLLLVRTHESAETWRERLGVERITTLPIEGEESAPLGFVGAACAGAAARLLGVLTREALEASLRIELAVFGPAALQGSLDAALAAFDRMSDDAGSVREGPELPPPPPHPDWVDVPFEVADVSAPAVHGGLTSVQVRTGLWRTLRPIVDESRCTRCSWICSNFCPDSAISIDADRRPRIDYDHCKGCMICVTVCPPHAISAVPEAEAAAEEAQT